ncbi:GDSL-type esterase/lipase family protein [Mariniflexile sp. AS56]|uniref:GDSL-type esterase/lipase family protein n=1 Tax=Mariniflexile sp. AS56 TaxID=3063957 RepID=UPI0026EBBB8C|nr:GDSL-type esterase/lipase family protein [Mariniflexile sp. AS56]MDO7173765.1 GDSL-type esterase/lipase family protein [Mariniflexile sp. AS56]
MNAQTEVIMAGVGGNNTIQMLNRINSDLLVHNPTTTILLAGTNDMLNSGKLVPLNEFGVNIRNIIDQVLAVNSDIILMTIPPCIGSTLLERHDASYYEPEGPNGRVIQANQVLAEIAVEKNIVLIDTYSLFNNDMGLLSSDGVHPTNLGYQSIADLAYNAIVENNFSTSKIVCFGDSITTHYPELLYNLLTGASGETLNSGEFEFLFDTDGDFEGWTSFNNPSTTSMAVTSGELQATYAATNGYLGIQHQVDLEFSSTHPYLAIKIDHLPASRMSFYMASSWYNNDKDGFSSLANTTLNNAGIYVYDLSTNGPGFGASSTQIFNEGLNYTDTNRVIFLIDDNKTSGTTNAMYNDIEWIKNFTSLEDIAAYAGLTLGVIDLKQDEVSVYPNPVNNILTVNIPNTKFKTYTVIDLNGRVYKQGFISNYSDKLDIDLVGYSKGLYIISLIGDNIKKTIKVVKK